MELTFLDLDVLNCLLVFLWLPCVFPTIALCSSYKILLLSPRVRASTRTRDSHAVKALEDEGSQEK